MALNIAAMQTMASPVSSFLEGRAIRRAEQMQDMQMQQAQAAEGRAVEQAQRESARFNWEQESVKKQFDQESAKQMLAGANQVLAIPKGQRKAFVEKNFPDFVAQLSEQEYGWEEVDEDEIEEMAQGISAQSSAALGISPSKPTPLSDAGKVTADVRAGLLTQQQGDAILNATEYTAPEAGVVDGKEVVYRLDKKTGQPQIVPGISPRPQKPLVSLDMKAELASEKKFGELEAEAFSGVLQRGQDAQDKSAQIRSLLNNPAKTGPTQDFRASANALFSDLGVPIAQSKIDQISDLAGYKGALNQLVLTEQLKQKGPQTESDAKRIEQSFGKTTNIKEANELILKYQLALAERESLLAERAEQYREASGKIDGWRKELRSYVRDTPLAAVNEKTGRLFFWNEYRDQMKARNPEASDEEIMAMWRQKNAAAR